MIQSECDRETIQAYLSETLDQDSELRLIEHLDQCQQCRATLQGVAASQQTWQAAQMHLSDTEHDVLSLSGLLTRDQGETEPGTIQSAEIQNVLSSLAPTDDPHMLGRIGPYEVAGVVGAGGMGIVLKAVDPALDRTVAIKVLAPHLASSGSARQRFAREAKAAAAVLHPNVMAIHSVANEGPSPYLVMPYLRGVSLQKRIDEEGSLSTIEIVRIAAQVAAGLAAAHEQGLVHRDIKPANIMLSQGTEQVAIMDFGLARAVDDATMTRSGMIAGTPQYMSPEQAFGEAVDARSDLFSLGSLVYAMCTGHSPFRAENSFAVMRRILEDAPRQIEEINPSVPVWLNQLVTLLHQKSPHDRIQSAREVAVLLNQCLEHLERPSQKPVPALLTLESDTTQSTTSWPFDHKLQIGILSALVLGMVAWTIFGSPLFQLVQPLDLNATQSPKRTGAAQLNAVPELASESQDAVKNETEQEPNDGFRGPDQTNAALPFSIEQFLREQEEDFSDLSIIEEQLNQIDKLIPSNSNREN